MSVGIKRTFVQMDENDTTPLHSLPPSRYGSPEGVPSPTNKGARAVNESKQPSPEPVSAPTGSLTRRDSQLSRRHYEAGASIVLIGIRGSGKSSLAVLAATAYNRRLVDFERAFQERTGHTLTSHRQSVGITEHHKRHRQILAEVLHDHGNDCVIVCNFSDLEQGARLLRQFAHSHPVIHIVRDVKGIQSHVKVWSEEKIAQLLAISGRLLRSCSNFEFFNRTQPAVEPAEESTNAVKKFSMDGVAPERVAAASPAPFLTLKRAERDFLTLLRLILEDNSRTLSQQSAYPLSQMPLERRPYTYAVTIRASDVLAGVVDLGSIQTGVDAIQIMYDYFPDSDHQDAPYVLGEVYSQVRRETFLPLILEVTRDGAPAATPLEHEKYAQYLNYCLRFAPEYLVIDFSMQEFLLQGLLSIRGNTKIIAQFSHLERLAGGWDDAECLALFEKAETCKADVVQMTLKAKSNADYLPVQGFRHKIYAAFPAGPPLCAFETGIHGRRSQCFNPVLSPVIHASLPKETGNRAIGCVSAQQATNALFASFVLDAQRFCIIGGNVNFSLSPAMHNAAYVACGIPHTFSALSTDSIQTIKELALDHAFGGAAVTQPYKVEVTSLLHSVSQHARIIRAVNTVLPVRDDQVSGPQILMTRNLNGHILELHGDNTDWIGIRSCIRRGLSPINTVRSSSCGLVIGAGGMARAAVYAMLHMGVRNIFICNRTVTNAEELANHYNNHSAEICADGESSRPAEPQTVRVIQSFEHDWPAGFRPPTMVVSSVPATDVNGTLEASFTLPEAWLTSPTGGVVVELTYKPLITSLVRQIRARSHKGWNVMNGLDMLPEQAFAQFELFTGRRAPRRIMREQVINAYRQDQENENARTRQHSLEPTPVALKAV